MRELTKKAEGKCEALITAWDVKTEGPFVGAGPISRFAGVGEGDGKGVTPRIGKFGTAAGRIVWFSSAVPGRVNWGRRGNSNVIPAGGGIPRDGPRGFTTPRCTKIVRAGATGVNIFAGTMIAGANIKGHRIEAITKGWTLASVLRDSA